MYIFFWSFTVSFFFSLFHRWICKESPLCHTVTTPQFTAVVLSNLQFISNDLRSKWMRYTLCGLRNIIMLAIQVNPCNDVRYTDNNCTHFFVNILFEMIFGGVQQLFGKYLKRIWNDQPIWKFYMSITNPFFFYCLFVCPRFFIPYTICSLSI